jgi:hypothetical protein
MGDKLDGAALVMDEARALLRTAADGMGYSDAELGLVASIETLADAAIRLQEGNQLLAAELAVVTEHRDQLTAEVMAVTEHRDQLAAEVMAVNEHRDQLTADLLAVCSSQSWRLGHALTWPARALLRRDRRTIR